MNSQLWCTKHEQDDLGENVAQAFDSLRCNPLNADICMIPRRVGSQVLEIRWGSYENFENFVVQSLEVEAQFQEQLMLDDEMQSEVQYDEVIEVKDESLSESEEVMTDEFCISMDPDTHGQDLFLEDIVNEDQYGGVTTMEAHGDEDIVNEEQYGGVEHDDGEHTEDEDLHDEDEGDNDDDDDEGGEISQLLASAGRMLREACPPWRANRPEGSIASMGSKGYGSKGYGGKCYGSKGKGYHGGKGKGSKSSGWHV